MLVYCEISSGRSAVIIASGAWRARIASIFFLLLLGGLSATQAGCLRHLLPVLAGRLQVAEAEVGYGAELGAAVGADFSVVADRACRGGDAGFVKAASALDVGRQGFV